MIRERLTPERIRRFTLAEGAKQSFLWDSDVPKLAVRVTAGSRAFVFESKLQRQTMRITIGNVSDWVVGDARTEARRLQTLVDQNIDPRALLRDQLSAQAQARTEKAAAEALGVRRKQFTLKALCEAYVEHLRARGKAKSARDSLSAFRVHVFTSEHASAPANGVTSLQIAEMVRKVFESGKERTAGILRNYLVAAFNAARRAPFDATMLSTLIAFEVINNPAEIVPAISVNRGERTLTPSELKQYMEALRDTPVDTLLLLHLYSAGQRMEQLARAKVSDYVRDTGTLRLWDGKGKRAQPREHLLPLHGVSRNIVDTLSESRSPDARLVGANARDAGDRIAEICKLLKCSAFSVRDIRRTVETELAGLGVSKQTRAHLLSHGLGGVQDAHYDRHSYTEEKRAALRAWEVRLEQISTGALPVSNVKKLVAA